MLIKPHFPVRTCFLSRTQIFQGRNVSVWDKNLQGDRWQSCSFKSLEELCKKIIFTQSGKIQKETHRGTLIITLHKKERGILLYSSAPGYNWYHSHPTGLVSSTGQWEAWESALGLQVTTETVFLLNSTIFFYSCNNFVWKVKLVISASFFCKIVFEIKITTCLNPSICQWVRLMIYQKYIKGALLICFSEINNKLFYLP